MRRKHTGEFPKEAIEWCLRDAGITTADLTAVAFDMKPTLGVGRRAIQILRGLPGSLRMLRTRGGPWAKMVALPRHFAAEIGPVRAFEWVAHHEAHAASAFFPSPFERAAVLVVDGAGEIASTTGFFATGTQLKPAFDVDFPNSLGYFYSALTEYLGFRPSGAEGKTMGLASYGEPARSLLTHFDAMIDDDGRVDTSWFRFHEDGVAGESEEAHYFGPRWIEAFGPPREPESELTDRHYALAATGQRRLETILMSLLRRLHRTTGVPNVCLAGGVALNCVANGRIVEETPFERVWIQPVAHDAGAGLGAALLAHMKRDGPRRPQTRVDWGPRYDAAAIDDAIAAAGLEATVEADPAAAAAARIASGRVVGWFEGRVALGPRALGHRSILADPRAPEMPDRVNQRIKRRERFRPFAPAVLEERAGEWFSGAPTPFMTTVHRVLQPDRVPAITHVDGTARVQTVSVRDSPAFHAVISAFEAETGVPIVLNTSFNLRGEPIVCRPQEAIADFVATELDDLFLEDRRVSKPG